jgi:hypothetical protein
MNNILGREYCGIAMPTAGLFFLEEEIEEFTLGSPQ